MRVIDYIKVDGPMPEDIPDTQYLYENGQHQFHYDKYERSKFNHDWGYIPFLPNAVNCINADFDDRDILSFNFTGCLMVVWLEVRGSSRDIFVGHVSTGEFGDCKDIWDGMKTDVKRWYEFRPSDAIKSLPSGVALAGCYGGVAFGDDFRSVTGFGIVLGRYPDGRVVVINKEKLLPTSPL